MKSDLNTVSDLITDEKCVDLYRIEKYFEESTWADCLKLYVKKKKLKWFCSVCQKIISMSTNSVLCERCLKWNRLGHTSFIKWKPLFQVVQSKLCGSLVWQQTFWFWANAVTSHKTLKKVLFRIFFFYLGFLSQPFTNHRTAGEGEGIS